MTTARNSSGVGAATSTDDPISAYSEAQLPAFRAMCDELRGMIEPALPNAASKVWHGSPVWFIDDNPVVGYSATATTVNLLFWNGKAIDEAALAPVGKYGAAQAVFTDASQIDPVVVGRWLEKAREDVFDSRAFFKNLRKTR
jgi:hypothetical protein